MEVQLRPPFNGCLIALATVFSWGLYPLFRWHAERRFIRRMDDEGVETRGGTRIAWNEFTGMTRMRANMHGWRLSDECLLESPKGRVSLPLWRMGDSAEALDYMLRRLPPNIGR